MKKNVVYSIVLVFSLLMLSVFVLLVWDQVSAQPINLPNSIPQVVVRPPAEPPKWLVDFSWYEDPMNPARKIRVITVVDPESKHIVVYHEDLATGQVKLLSSRNIQNDLLLDQFNAVSPTPSEIEIEKDMRRFKNQN
ncbi:MAG: hypothetical protein LBL62_03255 [Planctomycetaceae bacterium]|jgi:predicted PurR-regulated permease PerM|nr:hypothetical protein [Planctomycetaceae bacterium]